MGNSVHQVKKLFRQYLSGNITDTDAEVLKDAVAKGKADEFIEESFTEVWNSFSENTDTSLAQARKEKIFQSIHAKVDKPLPQEIPATPRYAVWKRLAVAAIVAGIVIATAIWGYNTRYNAEDLLARIPDNFTKFTNQATSNATLPLPDGSLVVLNPGSTLYFPEKFSTNERLVMLQGNAFFEVMPDKSKPFVVESNKLRTHVLGTSFWVKESTANQPAAVIVCTGKVMVSAVATAAGGSDLNPVTLLPNHQLKYFEKSGEFELTLADSLMPIPASHSLQNGKKSADVLRLEYEKPTPLYKVAEDLQQLYGVEIKIENAAMRSCLLTGDLSVAELHKKLEIICLSLGATYATEGTSLVIKGPGCGL
ncbi:MAG: FecR domain-containing protein [Chitinophagaceae bacterium]|nr:FecR domain-containing protein [Chitinophagaceae bacterium]